MVQPPDLLAIIMVTTAVTLHWPVQAWEQVLEFMSPAVTHEAVTLVQD
jgi:hypothetical protein